MIPLGDPLKAVLGLALIVAALIAFVVNVIMIVLARRRENFAIAAFAIGAGTLITFTAYLLWSFSSREIFPTWIAAWFFAPIALGVGAMVAGARTDRARAISVAGLIVMVIVILGWRSMEQRSNLYFAVLEGDGATAYALVDSGVGRDEKDKAWRQDLLIRAARNGKPQVVTALLYAGADPNVPFDGKRALTEAVNAADLLWRPATPEDALRTVTILLDHGADPNQSGEGHVLPFESAWLLGREKIAAVLKSRGARTDVLENFESLMTAAAAGDVARVKDLATGRLLMPRFQHDLNERAPLVAAAENGRVEVIDVLLERYGQELDSRVRNSAMKAATEKGQAAAVARLR